MEEKLSGKTILITGATDGLGKLVAQDLASKGAMLLLHGRSNEKGKKLVDELFKQTRNDKLKYYNADYSSFEEVNSLSEHILEDQSRIDILINNAAIGSGSPPKVNREISKDGIELRFAVDYLSHVLITEKLLPLLPKGTGQIINVASVGQEPIDFSNLMLEKDYDGLVAYRRSKTALIMYSFDLAAELANDKISVNALHPASLMNTKMVMEGWGYSLTTVEQGAEALESLISASTTGEYYDGKQISKAIKQAYDSNARAKLKQVTWKLLDKYL